MFADAGPAGFAAFSTQWGRCRDEVVTDGVRPAAASKQNEVIGYVLFL